MRLPIPPSGRPQPIILLFGPILVKEATTSAQAAAPPRQRRTRAPRERARAATPRAARRPRRATAEPARARPRRRGDIDPALLPSRAAILDALQDAGVPLPPAELARALAVDRRARDAFVGRLAAMERDGQLLRQPQGRALRRRQARPRHRHRAGPSRTASASSCPTTAAPTSSSSPREMHKVLHGDRVTARRDRRRPARPARRRDRRRARARQPHASSAGCYEERGIAFVVAENRRINQDLLVPPGRARQREVRRGRRRRDRRAARRRSARRSRASSRCSGSYTDPGHGDRDRAAQARPAARVLARRRKRRPASCRREVRDARPRGPRRPAPTLPLVTIDGETAKDFDDAVYCERKGKRLPAARRDRRRLALRARRRRARPRRARARHLGLLPAPRDPDAAEALSNELCSLKPDVDRLCMVCEMEVTADGRDRASYRFYPGGDALARAPHLHAGVAAGCRSRRGAPREAKRAAAASRGPLRALPGAAGARAKQRGAIDFDTVEMQLEFDVQGKIVRIVPVVRNDAHRLIEECMLAANVCAADFLAAARAPGALPRARGPDAGEARARCATSSASCGAVAARRRRADGVGLRAAAAADQGPARLRAAADGAAALAAAGACTGRTTSATSASPTRPTRTSPRRSAAIRTCSCTARSRRCSRGSEYKPAGASWAELGVHCSVTERRADDATRDVENWLKCYFMQDKVGETFDGTISGVTSFGLFVTLDELNIDGLVHVTELGRDYFHFDAGAPRADRRAQRPRVPARRPRAREGRARRPRDDEDRLHAGRARGRGAGRRARSTPEPLPRVGSAGRVRRRKKR